MGESTPVILTVGSLLVLASALLGAGITWGRLGARIKGLEESLAAIRNELVALESWLHERDAQATSTSHNHEIRLYRLEDYVGVTQVAAVPRHVMHDPTPPPREVPIARVRTQKPGGG